MDRPGHRFVGLLELRRRRRYRRILARIGAVVLGAGLGLLVLLIGR